MRSTGANRGGKRIIVGATGASGLPILIKCLELIGEQPDIVVCDVMMPEMDGLEFTKRLKANFNISHIPVILLTAYSSEEHQLKGIQAGRRTCLRSRWKGWLTMSWARMRLEPGLPADPLPRKGC